MQDYTALAYIVISAGTPSAKRTRPADAPDGDLFSASISPEGPGQICVCDIDAWRPDLPRVTATLEAMGATIELTDADPPYQGLVVTFGNFSAQEVIEKLREVFLSEEEHFDYIGYQFRFDADPEAIPRLLVSDNSNERGMVCFFDNRDEQNAGISPAQWQEFAVALEIMTVDSSPVFTHVEANDLSVLAYLSGEAIPERLVHLLEAARVFPG